MTPTLTDETWALIAPRRTPRRRAVVTAFILAIMALLAVASWWTGIAAPRLSATPTLIEPGSAKHQVKVHVDLRNEGLVAATASSVSPGTTLPVRSIEPHLADGPEPLVLPGWGWELPAGTHRSLVLELDVPCGRPTGEWRLEMVAYGPTGGREVHVPWRTERLPDWQRTVLDTVCG
ncbi:hypothetical protein [Streptosporangium sp. NPDC000396]|uniref:hypothetical protein n=1 Tax=Streptosporangium sp. NPDC000396 TaxID=3366185 RepID=UPI0036CAB2FD